MPKTNSNLSNSEIVNYNSLRDKIYEIRGQKVMLDYDLAKIYGYTTSAFNQQVKNNKEKFEGEDFMFQLTDEDLSTLSISKNLISMQTKGTRGGRAKMPYVFTEQGVYMLMTVLRGDLATRQSKALIRLFKSMKDYVLENQAMLEHKGNLEIAFRMMGYTQDLAQVKTTLNKLGAKIKNIDAEIYDINQQLSRTVSRSELSPIMLDFSKTAEQHEYIFLNGQPAKASEVYEDLYAKAEQSIYLIDNYIDIKTLRHFQKTKPEVGIIIFSDNLGNYLHYSDYLDFQKERPNIKIDFVQIGGGIHDRFIILDYGAKSEAIYHCGSSAKDAGNKMAAIGKLEDEAIRSAIHPIIDKLKAGKKLKLK